MKKQLNIVDTLRTYIEYLYARIIPEYSYEDILLACELATILPDSTGNDRYRKMAAFFMFYSNDYLRVLNDYEIDPIIAQYCDTPNIDWPEKQITERIYQIEFIKAELVKKLNARITLRHREIFTDLPAQDMIYRKKLEEAKAWRYNSLKGSNIFVECEEDADEILEKYNETMETLAALDKERKKVLKAISVEGTLEGLASIDYHIQIL